MAAAFKLGREDRPPHSVVAILELDSHEDLEINAGDADLFLELAQRVLLVGLVASDDASIGQVIETGAIVLSKGPLLDDDPLLLVVDEDVARAVPQVLGTDFLSESFADGLVVLVND